MRRVPIPPTSKIPRAIYWAFEAVIRAAASAIALSVVATYLIVKIISPLIGGIRISEEDETKGLDQALHGENAYTLH